ncbi:MAG: S8 family serine peptidase, partial [Actinobacteria bacterium]|nr:S8 family serine peptidase [Actinomycetota bacterium]
SYGHGTGEARDSVAEANNEGDVGTCPDCQVMHLRVGDSFIADVNDFAQAVLFGTDTGATLIQSALGTLNNSRFAQEAIDYAYRRGAVLVAAVGNADGAPSRPWPFASYPAALPHVIGVSALARDGSVPSFSDRDKILNDIAAPGDDIFSTLPRALTAARPACVNQGYSDCGPDEYRHAQGTSFAAPQVTAAAAVLRAARPDLRAGQVMNLLTRSATDVGPPLRDALTGWGRLDVTAALAAAESYPLPPADAYETNDDAGGRSRRLWGRRRVIVATVDYWDDQTDVYQVRLRPGERLVLSLRGPTGSKLILWQPGTERVEGFSIDLQRRQIVQSRSHRAAERLAYRAPVGGEGWYFVQVKLQEPGSGPYRLEFSKS